MFNVKSQSLNIRAKFESHLRIKKKYIYLASVVAHSFKFSIQEAEAGGMLSLEPAWSA